MLLQRASGFSFLSSQVIPSSGRRVRDGHANAIPDARAFSTGSPRRIIELTGPSQERINVREAVAKICLDFHAALAKDGWIGIALREGLGSAGLGISEATIMLQTVRHFHRFGYCVGTRCVL